MMYRGRKGGLKMLLPWAPRLNFPLDFDVMQDRSGADGKKDDIYLLDVRESDEWDFCRLSGATLIPLSQMKERYDEVTLPLSTTPPPPPPHCISKSLSPFLPLLTSLTLSHLSPSQSSLNITTLTPLVPNRIACFNMDVDPSALSMSVHIKSRLLFCLGCGGSHDTDAKSA